MSISESFNALRPKPNPNDALVVELVFDTPIKRGQLRTRIGEILPNAVVTVETGLEEKGADRFHFVTFSDATVSEAAGEAFAFTRQLKQELGAVEAAPVSVGLYDEPNTSLAETGSGIEIVPNELVRSNLSTGWVHEIINTAEMWKHSKKGAGVLIASIDTGYSDHQELADVIHPDNHRNFLEGGTDARDRFNRDTLLANPGHGTMVMSVASSRGGITNSGSTFAPGLITGVAPNSRVLPIRTITSVAQGGWSYFAKAIRHAVASGSDVIAIAFGTIYGSFSAKKALEEAVEAGVIIVAAAGNVIPWVVHPAKYSLKGLCTAVAAVDSDLKPWNQSSSGKEVNASAPGVHVWCAWKGNAHDNNQSVYAASGTTFSAALTAGIAANWISMHGREKLEEAATKARTTVQSLFTRAVTYDLAPPSNWSERQKKRFGAGVVDGAKTMQFPLPELLLDGASVEPTEKISPAIEEFKDYLNDVAGQNIAAEFTENLYEYADELLWLSRLHSDPTRSSDKVFASNSLERALNDKSALKELLGL